jgi:hypothetical protein
MGVLAIVGLGNMEGRDLLEDVCVNKKKTKMNIQ